MHIKRYTERSVKDAMNRIKAELGADALILSTKRLEGAESGLYEVIAAVDYDLSSPVEVKLPQQKRQASDKTNTVMNADPERAGQCGERMDGREPGGLTPGPLERELEEIKELCWTMVARSRSAFSELFTGLESELVGNGIDPRLVRKALGKCLKGFGKGAPPDAARLKASVREKFYNAVTVTDPLATGGITAFVGPTGVGKTTTLAKLAAAEVLKKKRRVALVTLDNYRIAAAEQLKVYGKVLGVPVEVAGSVSELGRLVRLHDDKDQVLIDTAGRNPGHAAQTMELRALCRAIPGVRLNLVLSSQTREKTLYGSVRGLEDIPVQSLTFTKLDEGDVYGPMLNTMILADKPIAYLTTGQRVPEDIEVATKNRLVDLFIPKEN